jgi:hypothetical protein
MSKAHSKKKKKIFTLSKISLFNFCHILSLLIISTLCQRRDIYSEQQKKCLTSPIQTHSSSYNPWYNKRFLQNLRFRRKIRHNENTINSYTLNCMRRLPRQNTSDPFSIQFFNGINF